MLRAAAAVIVALVAGAACQNSTTSVAVLTMQLVTPSHDDQTMVVPSAPQHVALNTAQSFAVNAASGYEVTQLVGGTCPIGTWTRNIYTTGAVTGDCTAIFSSVLIDYDVSVTGAHVVAVPSGDLSVPGGTSQAFAVPASVGYELSNTVGGTCATGTWSGATYTTGPIDANCSLSFSATPVYFTVTPGGANLSTAPVGPQPILWGRQQTFTVVPDAGYTLSPNIAGSCPTGDWNGTAYTTAAIDANCTVVFGAFVTPAPQVTVPNLTLTSVSTVSGNTTYDFAWTAPQDSSTLAADQNYTLCASHADPNYDSFSTAAAVLAGQVCVPVTGTAAASITVETGHAYLFNVVVSNVYRMTAIYQARGEFADAAQLHYMPFDSNTKDMIGNLDLVPGSYINGSTTGGTQANDRFDNPNSSRAFSAAAPDCLMTPSAMENTVTGTNPRTLAFWLRSGVSAGASVPIGIGGNGSAIATGDHFGLYNTVPSGTGVWNQWFLGDDVTLSATYNDNSAWQFWVLTYSSTGTVARAYLNGQQVGERTSWSPLPSTASAPLWVGCGVDGNAGQAGTLQKLFNGQVDDIRVFERVLCDGTGTNGCVSMVNEIANLYNVSRP